MTDTPTDRAAPKVLVIDVEGADQDGAMVAWEYTATGMRFRIRGALAAAIAAIIKEKRDESLPKN